MTDSLSRKQMATRVIDLCIAAGLAIGLVDAGSAAARGSFGVLAFVDVLAACLLGGALIAPLLVGVSLVTTWADAPGRVRPAFFGFAAAVILGLPPIGAALQAGPEFEVAAAALIVVAPVVMGLGYWLTLRLGRGALWLVASMLAVELATVPADSVSLVSRIRAEAIEPPLLLAIGLYLGTVPLAVVLTEFMATATKPRASGLVPISAGVVGVAIAIAAANVEFGRYAAPRVCAFAIALSLLGLAAGKVLPPIRPRWRLTAVAASLAMIAHLRAIASPIEPTSWQLASRTALVAELLQATGFLDTGFEKLWASLQQLPAAREGERFAAAAVTWNEKQPPARQPRHTVVLVTIDTLRYDHLGYSGSAPAGLTPTLDRLAERSVRFHRAYAQGGWTSLSIPALMWSRHPERIAFTRIFEDAYFRLFLEEDVAPGETFPRAFQSPRSEPRPSLAEVLRVEGIATVAVTNDGFTQYFEPRLGMVRGFADAVYPRHVLEERDPTEVPFEIPDSLAIDLALDALDRHPGERTFLWVHLFGPHEPYDRRPNSDPAWTDYQSEVHEVDRQVGRLLEGLAARDERSDALVIVTADHGEELGDHGGQSHGLQAYEECIRVPLLVAIPAGAGRDVHEPVGLVDLSPTILSEFGLESPDSFEGFELGPALRGEAFDRPPVLSETWRVPVRDEARNPHFIAAVDGPMKVVVDLRHSTFAFYDLDADPGERENLVASISAEKRDDYLRLAAFALGAHDATP